MIVQRRGIVCVPGELGQESCWPTPKQPGEIANRHLRQELTKAGERFVHDHEYGGVRFHARDGLHVYGPFPSMERLAPLLDDEAMGITQEARPAIVLERDSSPQAFALYLLVANFTVARSEAGLRGVN